MDSASTEATPQYRTGEPARQGDRVQIGDWNGRADFIVTPESAGREEYWKTLGAGVMFEGPDFGSMYVQFDDEGLEFVGQMDND